MRARQSSRIVGGPAHADPRSWRMQWRAKGGGSGSSLRPVANPSIFYPCPHPPPPAASWWWRSCPVPGWSGCLTGSFGLTYRLMSPSSSCQCRLMCQHAAAGHRTRAGCVGCHRAALPAGTTPWLPPHGVGRTHLQCMSLAVRKHSDCIGAEQRQRERGRCLRKFRGLRCPQPLLPVCCQQRRQQRQKRAWPHPLRCSPQLTFLSSVLMIAILPFAGLANTMKSC